MMVYEAEPAEGRPESSKSMLEQLLSPETLQRMMACGGGLLVVGLVAWLWSIGLFDEPVVAASVLGATTLGVIGAGIWLYRNTRHELAGTGLTLLGSLALPLNLWFYDTQGLITISEGGRLWIPAAICCAIYASIARVLRKPMFVYTLVGGIVLTGMLFLADEAVGRFWELMPPVTFLVVIGWLSVFSERLFPKDESDFSQAKFGFAFHRVGVAVLIGGFCLLLGGQLAGHFAAMIPFHASTDIATQLSLQYWALAIVGLSLVPSVVQRATRPKPYSAMSIGLLAWSIAILVDIVAFKLQLPHAACLFATFLIGRYAWSIWFEVPTYDGNKRLVPSRQRLQIGTTALLAVGFVQFLPSLIAGRDPFFGNIPWVVCAQLGLTAIAGFLGWYAEVSLHRQAATDTEHTSVAAEVLAAAASLMSVCTLVYAGQTLEVKSFEVMFVLLYSLPLAFAGLAWANRNTSLASTWQQLVALANAACLVHLAGAYGLGVITATSGTVWSHHASWTMVLAVAAVFFFVSGLNRNRIVENVMAGVCLVLALTQVSAVFGASIDHSLVLAPTLCGLALVGFALWRRDEVAEQVETPASALILSGSLLGTLLGICRVIAGEVTVGLFVVLCTQLLALAIGSLATSKSNWRLAFRGAGVACVATILAALNSFIGAHWLIRLELGTVGLGLALLAMGHIAWYREGEDQDDGATALMWTGSLLSAVPLAIGVLAYRYDNSVSGWAVFHNISGLLMAMSLIGAGLACRIRSTTLSGSALLTTYIVSLIVLIRIPHQLQTVSVYMMVAGGAFFGTAMVLSLFREQLIKLPGAIRDGKGAFRVLHWR